MELTEQERKLEKSAIKAYVSLLAGLFGLALLVDVQWQSCLLFLLGAVSALFIIYLIIYLVLPHRWKQKRFLNKVATELAKVQIENVIWLIVLGTLGISLQHEGYVILGAVCGFSGIGIFLYCTCKGAKRRKEMGTEERNIVKKPKKQKQQIKHHNKKTIHLKVFIRNWKILKSRLIIVA